MKLRRLDHTDAAALERWLRASRREHERALEIVAPIVAQVRRRGDRALRHWTRKLEGRHLLLPGAVHKTAGAVAGEPLRYGREAMETAWLGLPAPLRRALRHAARNIDRMAGWQRPRAWRRAVEPGVWIGQVLRPLQLVGCYIPGGRHPLPSTLLMTALPARRAGVGRVLAVCPAPSPVVLGAAWLAGVEALYAIGGAQAIAALAYGTESVPKVDKIVGPGNLYVTAAKQLVAHDCAIDFPAGPTEVLWLAGADAPPAAVAADLLAQAEHDPHAAAWLLTPSRALARRVEAELERQLADLPQPNRNVAARALARRGAVLLTRNLAQAAELANRLAPEHITVPAGWENRVRNAGSIFAGAHAPQAVGDYMSGANHVLPTAGLARLRGGLSVYDFLKIITVQELTSAGLARLAPDIAVLARAEGLEAHARSVELRAGGRR